MILDASCAVRGATYVVQRARSKRRSFAPSLAGPQPINATDSKSYHHEIGSLGPASRRIGIQSGMGFSRIKFYELVETISRQLRAMNTLSESCWPVRTPHKR